MREVGTSWVVKYAHDLPHKMTQIPDLDSIKKDLKGLGKGVEPTRDEEFDFTSK